MYVSVVMLEESICGKFGCRAEKGCDNPRGPPVAVLWNIDDCGQRRTRLNSKRVSSSFLSYIGLSQANLPFFLLLSLPYIAIPSEIPQIRNIPPLPTSQTCTLDRRPARVQRPMALKLLMTMSVINHTLWKILNFGVVLQQLGDSLGKGAFGQVYRTSTS